MILSHTLTTISDPCTGNWTENKRTSEWVSLDIPESGRPSYQAILGLEGHMLLSRGDISTVFGKLPWMLNDSTLRVRRGS